jgi:hypothetical protein
VRARNINDNLRASSAEAPLARRAGPANGASAMAKSKLCSSPAVSHIAHLAFRGHASHGVGFN